MESSFSQIKPNPTIKKNVINTRQRAQKAKRLQGIVVTASMAATLVAGLFFSQQDAQVAATAQANASSAAVVASVQQTAGSTPTPLISTIQVSNVSQVVVQATVIP